jgi:hypothetical protein
MGILVTEVQYPLTTEFSGKAIKPRANKPVSAVKSGMIWDYLLTGLQIGWGDSEIGRAAKEQGITNISYVEGRTFILLYLYFEQEVFIYGD